MKLIELLQSKRVFLDGGMGSSLINKGYSTRHGEIFNIEKPEIVKEIINGYLLAGSDVVLTNTFNANSKKADLSKYSLENIISSAIKIAKECVKDNQYVLYDCGPSGELMSPYGNTSFDEAYQIFAEQAIIVKNSSVDGIILETFTDLQELRAAILAFKENTDLPILCSMSFEKNGRTFFGVGIDSFALTAQGLDVDAIGINCGTGPEEMYANIATLIKYARVPVYAKANAGMPTYINGETVYSLEADNFAYFMQKIATLGINILGGCCGTDSQYIFLMKKATKDLPFQLFNNKIDAVCSYAKTVNFDNQKTLMIGERVNPTNKPLLKEAIKNDDYNYVLSMCLSQITQGADILDINVGMAGIDEAKKLTNTVAYVQGVADVPLCIDTSKILALTKALRVANGICIINSVNGEEASMENIFPLAKKYGCYMIALCLDNNGIPDNVSGRISIAKKIINKAKEYGIDKSKFLFDPLTLAVSVNTKNAIITLETITELKNKLDVKTTLGLSNVSFGLPNREKINSTFFELVRQYNSDTAIVNPSTAPGIEKYAYNLLTDKDYQCQEYIANNSTADEPLMNVDNIYEISFCIEKGYTNEGMLALKQKINENNYSIIIDKDIIGGLNTLGDAYEKGTAFLPQLMAGSETAKAMLDYIRSKYITESDNNNKATIVIATVKGDVHDIGKNIVKAVVSNYGYRVIDLGKDISTEVILNAMEKYKPQVLALSALMTTTLDNMTTTVNVIKNIYPNTIIMVGGAVVSRDYAQDLGIHYSPNAQEFVKQLQKLL